MKESVNSTNTLDLIGVEKDLLDYVKELAKENRCTILDMKYTCKTDFSLVYDTEPKNMQNFLIIVTLKSSDRNNMKFVEYLYHERIEKLKKLA